MPTGPVSCQLATNPLHDQKLIVGSGSLGLATRSLLGAARFDAGAYRPGTLAAFRAAFGAIGAAIRGQAAFATRHTTGIRATGFRNAASSIGAAVARWAASCLAAMVHALGGKTNRTQNHCANNQRPETFKHVRTPCVLKAHNPWEHGWATPKKEIPGSPGSFNSENSNKPTTKAGRNQIGTNWRKLFLKKSL